MLEYRISEGIYKAEIYKRSPLSILKLPLHESPAQQNRVNRWIFYFFSPSIGLYNTIGRIEGLPYPEAVFDGSFFRSNPKPFYKLVKQIYPQRLEPTATHRFFTLLHQKVCDYYKPHFI